MPLLRIARALLVFASLLAAFAAGADLRPLTEEALARSHLIPSVGRLVTYSLRLQAAPGRPLGGPVPVSLTVNGRPVARAQATVPAGGAAEVSLRWTPAADGWYDLAFTSEPPGGPPLRLALRVPVTARPTYFLWFGAPKRFQWCNVPTTVDTRVPAQGEWWLRRGALPCAWRGGVCYPKWTVEQFRQSYESTPWIAIDEVGGLDETGQKILTAVRAHKQRYPEGCRAVWFIGAHEYWKDYADCVDLFVPEVYLNYGGNHLGAIDRALRATRAADVTDQMIPGLGINIIYDKEKRPRVSPTKEDVLRQIRYLKTVAPELRGVGFFTSDSAAPGVAEYADQLCEEYYLRPVLSLVEGSLQARVADGQVTLSALVRNCGGMTAPGVSVQGGLGDGATLASPLSVALKQPLAPLQESRVSVTVPLSPGVHATGLRLLPATGVTLLNDTLWTTVARGVPSGGLVVSPPVGAAPGPGLPLFAPVAVGAAYAQAESLTPGGKAAPAGPATVLPALPGTEPLATWVPAAGSASSAFRLSGAAPVAAPEKLPPGPFSFTGQGYSLTLDPARDLITSLKSGGAAGTELLSAPWQFNCTAWEGFGPGEVQRLAAGDLVTVPLANDRATGFSRYFLYRDAPVIRVERYFQPRGELQVASSTEGGGFPQRCGTFACQAGAGSPVNRGELHDSKEYRDLLFGYLGDGPGPTNADRAGWFDMAFDRDGGGGLGVAIARRWTMARSDVGYDVTRYYDAGDYLQVMNLWGKPFALAVPQTQVLYLVVHGPLDLKSATAIAPAEQLWRSLHAPAQAVAVGL